MKGLRSLFRIPAEWTVQTAIEHIAAYMKISTPENFYLYYPAKGLVLEESRLFGSYNLDPSRNHTKVPKTLIFHLNKRTTLNFETKYVNSNSSQKRNSKTSIRLAIFMSTITQL